MAAKRTHSPELVPNPFIKKRNLEWSIDITGSTHDAVSSSSSSDKDDDENEIEAEEPSPPSPPIQDEEKKQHPTTASAVEAGIAAVDNHIDHFSALLAKTTLSPFPADAPHLPVEGYRRLYEANYGSSRGAHFIIHQHDHPIAGTHYDLRLQINETSSASWAIMYGPPGDPNSFRLNRNATETRIHCLWNHLIETASHATGSLLIWDTGTYSILPTQQSRPQEDPQSTDDEDQGTHLTEQENLHRAFANRKIRLQLHGSRLPSPYVLNLRLTRQEDVAGRARSTRVPKTRRRRGAPGATGRVTRSKTWGKNVDDTSSDSDFSGGRSSVIKRAEEDEDIVLAPAEEDNGNNKVSATERELRELEDEEVRRTNAYPGATNSIGSVHQRRWYLSLDREASGFVKRRGEGRVVWEPVVAAAAGEGGVEKKKKGEEGDEIYAPRLAYPFYVRGVEVERSVVTGRLGCEVLRDEGVVGYVGRKGWRAVLK